MLDGTIVGVALPAIIADLHPDLTDAQWVNSLYAVLLAALLFSTGNLADRWGRKRLFLAGLARLSFRAGKIFLTGKLLALGKACRLCCLYLLHGESKLTRGSGCRRLFRLGGDASHLLLGSVAGEALLLIGADRHFLQGVEERSHNVIRRLLPSWDDAV